MLLCEGLDDMKLSRLRNSKYGVVLRRKMSHNLWPLSLGGGKLKKKKKKGRQYDWDLAGTSIYIHARRHTNNFWRGITQKIPRCWRILDTISIASYDFFPPKYLPQLDNTMRCHRLQSKGQSVLRSDQIRLASNWGVGSIFPLDRFCTTTYWDPCYAKVRISPVATGPYEIFDFFWTWGVLSDATGTR